ncbi:E3 SUMO-protein ligase Su(var)2-10 isoform X2 [Lycorma delicatula]|uniref:E3 SUMO-protein ligase Su(var)2-10 isoform X2 n=1 Tax=Lycorma delicatula TaxID=130591 RepID=UPI003F5157A4
MSANDELKNMVMTFRVSELQMLLGFAGRNKSGRKTELQTRALELLRLKSTPIQMKIRELYKSIQQGLASGQPPGEPGGVSTSSVSGQGGASIVSNSMMAQQPPRSLRDPLIGGMQANPPSYTHYSQQRDPRIFGSNVQMYQSYPQKVNPAPSSAPLPGSYPVHPDVRFKNLPFYDMLGELLKPSSLMPQNNQRIQECAFMFHLTPSQATEISLSKDIGPGSKSDYIIQVQMRFCLLETSCEQDDFFPPGVIVKLNGKICPLPNPIPTNKPGVDPKRPPRPVNVTNFVRLSPTVANHVNITWAAEYGRGYAVGIYLVRKLTSSQLLQRLKGKGIRHADYTTGLIKEKLNEDADSEIATTSLRVSLICPLGKMRMTTPCRASTCSHLQCFDASLFLQMNERKPTWICPVCDKPCLFDKLVIDGYFQEVLLSSRLPSDITEVQLHQDGSWSTLNIKKEPPRVLSPTLSKKSAAQVIETIPVDEGDVGSVDNDEIIAETAAASAAISVTATATSVANVSSPSPVVTTPSSSATSTAANIANKEAPKRKLIVIDLTLSDSDDDNDDEPPLTVVKRSNTGSTGSNNATTIAVKTDSNNTTSVPASSFSSSGRLFSTDSNSNLSATGRSSVTSSGYTSPNIITLDSPSPPPVSCAPSPVIASHNTSSGISSNLASTVPTISQQQQQPYHTTMQPSLPTIYDLEADSNGSSSLFQPRY